MKAKRNNLTSVGLWMQRCGKQSDQAGGRLETEGPPKRPCLAWSFENQTRDPDVLD